MRVGEHFGVVESAACDGDARYLVQGWIDYLCLDLRVYLFDCVDPALRQRSRLRCRGFRRRPSRILLSSRGLAEPERHLGGLPQVLRSVDRSVRLGRFGVCPECLMAEVGKRLDYIEVRITERWINTQGESACQALKRIGRKGLCKVFQRKRMRCRDSTKYAQRGCIGEVAEALQSIQLGPSDTRSQSYRLLAKLSSLIY
jgi:hypothetical protein